jgi:hypothetical protein
MTFQTKANQTLGYYRALEYGEKSLFLPFPGGRLEMKKQNIEKKMARHIDHSASTPKPPD